jgi:hypothetical protein
MFVVYSCVICKAYRANFLDGKHHCSIKQKQRQIFLVLVYQVELFSCLFAQIIRTFEINSVLKYDVVWCDKLVEISQPEIIQFENV